MKHLSSNISITKISNHSTYWYRSAKNISTLQPFLNNEIFLKISHIIKFLAQIFQYYSQHRISNVLKRYFLSFCPRVHLLTFIQCRQSRDYIFKVHSGFSYLYRLETPQTGYYFIKMTVTISYCPHKVLKLVCQVTVEIFANFVAQVLNKIFNTYLSDEI